MLRGAAARSVSDGDLDGIFPSMFVLARLVLTNTLFHCTLQSIYREDRSLSAEREPVAEMESCRRWLWSLTSFAISIVHEKEEGRTRKKKKKSGAASTQKTEGPTPQKLGQKVGCEYDMAFMFSWAESFWSKLSNQP